MADLSLDSRVPCGTGMLVFIALSAGQERKVPGVLVRGATRNTYFYQCLLRPKFICCYQEPHGGTVAASRHARARVNELSPDGDCSSGSGVAWVRRASRWDSILVSHRIACPELVLLESWERRPAMDGSQFDGIVRSVTQSRRTVLGGAIATVAGVMGLAEGEAKKRRRKCKSPKVKCGKKCLPAGSCCLDTDCGTCQTCSGKTCVVSPSGTSCGVGGSCNGTACINQGAFGCAASMDFCLENGKMPCPRSSTPGAFCVVDLDGKNLCVTGGCIERGDQQDCEAALGPGAFEDEFCNACALLAPSEDGCFKPVTQ